MLKNHGNPAGREKTCHDSARIPALNFVCKKIIQAKLFGKMI